MKWILFNQRNTHMTKPKNWNIYVHCPIPQLTSNANGHCKAIIINALCSSYLTLKHSSKHAAYWNLNNIWNAFSKWYKKLKMSKYPGRSQSNAHYTMTETFVWCWFQLIIGPWSATTVGERTLSLGNVSKTYSNDNISQYSNIFQHSII